MGSSGATFRSGPSSLLSSASCPNGAPHTSPGQRPGESPPHNLALKGRRIVPMNPASISGAYAQPLRGRTHFPCHSQGVALGWYATARCLRLSRKLGSALKIRLSSLENTHSPGRAQPSGCKPLRQQPIQPAPVRQSKYHSTERRASTPTSVATCFAPSAVSTIFHSASPGTR